MTNAELDTEDEKRKMSTYDLLIRSAWAALDEQLDDGSFPPGHNRVYEENETPLRTTSRWLMTLSYAYKLTGSESFRQAALNAGDYLTSKNLRPHGYTFQSRIVPGKDQCDGLVGQARPLAALAFAGRHLNVGYYLETAVNLFTMHPFDDDLGLWEIREVDGRRLSFDRTLNHQITFAAASAECSGNNIEVQNKIETFLDCLPKLMELHTNGLIKHYVRPPFPRVIRSVCGSIRHWKLLLNEAVFHYYSLSPARRKKELGYHPVNLRSLAKLHRWFPNHPLWDLNIIERSLAFVRNSKYPSPHSATDRLDQGASKPGIATAMALNEIEDAELDELRRWITWDVEYFFDFNTDKFTRNTRDPKTSASTIFNLIYLPDIPLQLRV